MSQENDQPVPSSPEVESAEVREELHQTNITHKGVKAEPAKNADEAQSYMGAKEENVTPIRAPMTGPSNITSNDSNDNDGIEPDTEITPG